MYGIILPLLVRNSLRLSAKNRLKYVRNYSTTLKSRKNAIMNHMNTVRLYTCLTVRLRIRIRVRVSVKRTDQGKE